MAVQPKKKDSLFGGFLRWLDGDRKSADRHPLPGLIAYYFNGPTGQTVVGIKDFGPNGLSTASGTVVRGEKHKIAIKTDAGTTQTFEIANDASVETSEGVVSGAKFDPQDGAHVTVRYSQSNGAQVAQFIRAD